MGNSTDELLARAVPKLGSVSGEKAQALKGRLGRFAARAWAKGQEKLTELGLDVPAPVHAKARGQAREAAEDETGAFLTVARQAFSDDEAFVAFARGVAKAYVNALAKKKAREGSGVAKVEAAEEEKKEPEAVPALQVDEFEPDPPAPPPSAKKEESSDELPALEVPEDSSGELPAAKKKADPPAPKKKERGEFNRMSLDDEGETLEDAAKAAAPPPPPKAKEAEVPQASGPDAEASRAIERYRKTGDPLELGNARKHLKLALETARIPQARAAARASLALVHLLNGQDEEAKKLCATALEEDPACAVAVSVLARANEGEGARERLKAGLARARIALRSDAKKASREAKLLAEAFPDEPAPHLVGLVAASSAGEDIGPRVKAAWSKYPSPAFPDLALGDGFDLPAARAIVTWGSAEVAQGGTDALVKTQKDVEAKENLVAGAFQLALGVARTALATRTDLAKREEQALRGVAAEALLGLQFYDAAAAAYEKAMAIDRTADAAIDLQKGAERARELRRAFDRPGIKARSGAFEGTGLAALKKAVSARAARLSSEKQQESDKVARAEHEAVTALAGDASRRAALEKRAKAREKENPLGPLAEIEHQLKELETAKGSLGEKKPEEKKGFFSRALDKVKDTAKGAELAVRIKLLEGHRDDAYRAVAKNLRDAPSDGWGDAPLDELSAHGRALEAKLEHWDDELNRARKITAKLAEL